MAEPQLRDGTDALLYIRIYYSVPAYLGWRVAFTYQGRSEGVIVGTNTARLLVQFDGTGETHVLHPTWEVEYLGKPAAEEDQ